MELKKQTETVELINNLRKTAKKLHEDTTLHTVAFLMNDAADKLTEYMRADLERGLIFMEGSYCPRCGKEFFPTPMHAYKDGSSGLAYCSWTCFNHRFDETNENRAIEMLNFDGKTVLKTFTSVADALCYLGGSPKLLLRAIKTGVSYKRFKWRYKE